MLTGILISMFFFGTPDSVKTTKKPIIQYTLEQRKETLQNTEKKLLEIEHLLMNKKIQNKLDTTKNQAKK